MYCSSCKGVVHRTTKVCPHCGGDMTKLFGPKALWGKPTKPIRHTPDPDYKAEPTPKWLGYLSLVIVLPFGLIAFYITLKVVLFIGRILFG